MGPGDVTARLRIRHETVFRYSGEISASYNEARMSPVTEPGQATLHTRIDTRPASPALRYRDYWGTEVHAFDVNQPHDELQVVATSLVDTRPGPAASAPAGWGALADDRVRDTYVEWLQSTSRTEPDDELRALAAEIARGATPGDAGRAVSAFVHGAVEYVPGATGVHSRVTEVWQERKGVCQDIAHLTLVLLRLAGVPARYVSGYLHPIPDAGPGQAVTGESHAWVEWWDGGWTGYDPTNDQPAGERHVVVARGREYGDVAPFKGLYSGAATTSTLAVSVEITRL